MKVQLTCNLVFEPEYNEKVEVNGSERVSSLITEVSSMLSLYRWNYCTTAIFLLAGSVLVLSEKDVHSLPKIGHTQNNVGHKSTEDPEDDHNQPRVPADANHPPPIDNASKTDTREYRMYMQVAETILAMLRLSPLLAQEVQRCLNESQTFHEILKHLPRSLPEDSGLLAGFHTQNASKKGD